MFLKVRKQRRTKNHQLVPGCWHFSFSLFADQLSSRLFRVSGWACEMDKVQSSVPFFKCLAVNSSYESDHSNTSFGLQTMDLPELIFLWLLLKETFNSMVLLKVSFIPSCAPRRQGYSKSHPAI